jgi:hypothetical protein
MDRYQGLSNLVEKQRREDAQLDRKASLDKLRKRWGCHSCGKGVMIIRIWDHPAKGVMYYRSCNCCSNRTKMQPYRDGIEGIKEGEE